jgi:hypothetical protein
MTAAIIIRIVVSIGSPILTAGAPGITGTIMGGLVGCVRYV